MIKKPEEVAASKKRATLRHSRADAHINAQRLTAHTRAAQVQARQSQSSEKGVGVNTNFHS